MSKPKLGATKEFPRGKLNQHDEGGLMLAIGPKRESGKVDYGFKDRLSGFDIDATLEALHTQYQIRGDAIVARNSADAPTMKQLSDIRYAHLNIIPILKMLKTALTKTTSIEDEASNASTK